VHTFVIVKPTV